MEVNVGINVRVNVEGKKPFAGGQAPLPWREGQGEGKRLPCRLFTPS
jgi:hypothetical protein